MIRDEIVELLKKTLRDIPKLPYELIEPFVSVETPKESSNGDYSSNIAMIAFRKKSDITKTHVPGGKKEGSIWATPGGTFESPLQLAEKIVSIINAKYPAQNTFSRVEAVKPGFINFYLSQRYLHQQVKEVMEKGSSYGSLSIGKGKNASVEYVSANPTGPLHIGNARGGPLGDVIANVLEKAGYKVTREYLHNNVGGQVARLGDAIYFTLNPEQKGEGYEMQYQGEYIKELAQMVEEEMEEEQYENLSQSDFIDKAGEIAVEIMLSQILKDCQDMGIKYDIIKSESELRKEAEKVIKELGSKKKIKEKEGALWFAPNDEFLKDRETVVKKSDGEFTYFASDIVYHKEKFQREDLVVDILGANHSGHVPRLMAVVKALGFDTEKFKVILYQYVRLKRGSEIVKMSKRAGNFVTAREVLDEVGKDAFRFFLLRSSPETHMDFDLKLAKKQASDNPVFYVQYAYSRICSIFSKADGYRAQITGVSEKELALLTDPEEIALMRQLIKFPFMVEDISKTFAVNLFTNYAMEIANSFHKFYEAQRVISEDKNKTSARLALLEATRVTLKNTLDILGVSAPERM